MGAKREVSGPGWACVLTRYRSALILLQLEFRSAGDKTSLHQSISERTSGAVSGPRRFRYAADPSPMASGHPFALEEIRPRTRRGRAQGHTGKTGKTRFEITAGRPAGPGRARIRRHSSNQAARAVSDVCSDHDVTSDPLAGPPRALKAPQCLQKQNPIQARLLKH
jgi:hypothetical protein